MKSVIAFGIFIKKLRLTLADISILAIIFFMGIIRSMTKAIFFYEAKVFDLKPSWI